MCRLSFVLWALAACGGGGDDHTTTDQRAAATFAGVYGMLETVEQQALAALPVAQAVDFSGPCPAGGTSAMHGTYDGDGSAKATYTFDVTLAACADGEQTVDGQIHWTGAVTENGNDQVFTETIDGSVAYDGATYAGTFAFHDLTITTTVTGSSVKVTVTGTYTIGGKTYTVDPATWAQLFGG